MTTLVPLPALRNIPDLARALARSALCLVALAAAPAVDAAPSMQVWAGGDNTCAVVDGAAYCWGKNTDGQVGNNTFVRATSPTLVQGLSTGVSFVVTSGAHSCAIVNGGAYCWGNNDYGQLGNNGSTDSAIPVAVVGLSSGVTSIAVGDLHSCAVHNGAVKCWGAGGVGQLGTGGSIFSSAVPVQVTGLLSGATDVTTGRFNSCAIVNGGALCWGQGDSGEMGNGTNTYVNLAPVAVSGYGSGVSVLNAGAYFACGIQGAAAKCWGWGTSGRLGGGNTNSSNVPQGVVGLASGVTAITAGNGNHGCAVANGAASCWGLNNAGQLGNPAAAGGTTAPIGVQGLTSGMLDVSAGSLHTCGLSSAGISCWGGNAEGQLGTGNQTASPTPVLVIAAPVVATVLSASPATLDFGGQSLNTTSPAQLVTITNTGGVPVTFTDASIAGDFSGATDCATLAAGATCLVEAAFTPTAQGARTGRVNFVTTAGVFSIDLAGIGERSLVTHYYRSILRRAPDAGGKAFWESEATRMQGLGANVNETWYAMATFFYFSSEYQSFNRDDSGFVTDLYNTFFNRPADAGGLAFWTGLLAQGMPREVVLVSFMFSTEFQTFTQAIFGNVQARKEVDTVVDFYRGLLSRLPDNGGFANWVGQFRAAQCQGAGAVYTTVEAISSGFAGGAEYAGRNRTNAQYVGDLYNAFLRRGGDLAGVQFWISQLQGGATRSAIRQQFIASPEFTSRVNAIIAAGCVG